MDQHHTFAQRPPGNGSSGSAEARVTSPEPGDAGRGYVPGRVLGVRRRGRLWWLAGIGVLAIAGIWAAQRYMARDNAPAVSAGTRGQAAAPVVVANVQKKDMPVEFRSIGTIQTESAVAVRSRVDSVVDKVLVADGAAVRAGDVMVELDQRPIRAQIDQVKAVIGRDQAQVEQARHALARAQQLVLKDATSRVSVEDAQTNVDVAMANQRADEANLTALQLQLSFHTITAPISGRVGVVNVRPGTSVHSADQTSVIATINQIDPIYVAISVPQSMLVEVQKAQAGGSGRVEILDPGTQQWLSGPIAMLDNAVDTTTGLLTIRARVPNPNGAVWPGQVAQARVVFREEAGAVVVPSDAIGTSQSGTFVFVVDKDGIAHVKPVAVSRSTGEGTVVTSGVAPGDTVVIDGQLRLLDGSRVTITKSAANKGAAL
jgi:RND family efflux transporter MFP subunit